MSISNNVPGTRPLVLVIGARGALGALVADAFRRHGWAVRQSSREPIPPPDFHYVDLTDPATLAPALDGVDLVITTVPDPTLAAERHVLKRGGVLLNLSAGPAAALRSLRREPCSLRKCGTMPASRRVSRTCWLPSFWRRIQAPTRSS